MDSASNAYAKALLMIGLENDKAQLYLQQTKSLSSIFTNDKKLQIFLSSVVISKDEKKALIEKVMKDYFDQDLLNFLKLLIDKSRINFLPEICHEYKNLYYEHYDIKEAIIYSSQPLKEEKISEIKKGLEDKYHQDFVVENVIDSSLIAGVKVVIGDTVIDGSVKNKFARLKANINL